ncbi:MAG: NAD(P)/FAD-dependent oxidoreductase [Deltaproteobacteria bacterium]|nr:NAD(P)/FAD-dependent oxidoreductase [Deltaproteobacteria bacterium]
MTLTPDQKHYDAVVVGSGPNGLAAAITLGRKMPSVLLLEAKETIGGGCRSAEVTLPGFVHDICSAAHPLAVSSAFFRQLDLHQYGLSWVQPEIPLAHPFEDGSAVFLHRSLDITADALGRDGRAYKDLLAPFVRNYEKLLASILRPIPFPSHPFLMARFASQALHSVDGLGKRKFNNPQTQALFAGLAAHAMIPLQQPATAAFGIILAALAHAVGWPFVKGGSQKLADALSRCFLDRGGEIMTGHPVHSLDDMPRASQYFFDVTPRQLLDIHGLGLSEHYRQRLAGFRYGTGVYKMDWALREPIPWRSDICRKAGTVHLGNSYEEIAASVRCVNQGDISSAPYVMLAQQSLFDPSRSPEGRHTAWAYCHVPHGSKADMADAIEKKIERYAPGFREIILARSAMSAAAMEIYNPNYVGGDINGGKQDIFQLYTRPVAALNPYRTSQHNIFICSSSTPPGGGVHGLCGYYAARNLIK